MDGQLSWLGEVSCPIAPRSSPHATDVQGWLIDWVRNLDLPMAPPAAERFAQAGFARYAGRLYPDATPADLRVLAALFTWFFLLDDACDGPQRPTLPQFDAMRAGVLRLLRYGPQHHCPGLTGPMRWMLADAWRVPDHRMSTAWRARFVHAVAQHLDGTMIEVRNKAVGHRPSVTEYVTLRRATSAAYVSYALIEFATGQPVPDAVYLHPAVRQLADTGNDLLSWFNDLLSLERDEAVAGGHNLVLAVAREERIPVSAAIQVVTRRWQATMRRFVALRAEVPSFGPALDEPLRHYLDGVANSVRGTIDWSLESARYVDAGIKDAG